MTKHAWQDFPVTGGLIARDEKNLVEGRLELAGGLTLTFVMDEQGARWSWSPKEPAFAATRVSIADDADPDIQIDREEARLLAEHGIGETEFKRVQMLTAADHDLSDAQPT
jgi:hypothetical protein